MADGYHFTPLFKPETPTKEQEDARERRDRDIAVSNERAPRDSRGEIPD
jgi:hypothetical protein